MSLRYIGGFGIGLAAFFTLTAASALQPLNDPLRGMSPIVLAQAETDPVGAHAAIQAAKEMLSELDAAITALEEDAHKLSGDAQARANTALEKLRATRDAYREQIETALADIRQNTEQRVSQLRAALEDRLGEAESHLDGYLTTVNAELAIRTAVFKARLLSAQRYWQQTIEDLQTSVSTLTSEQRAELEKRIADLRVQVNERLADLQQSSGETWSAMRERLNGARQEFDETYHAILEGIQKAKA